MALHRLIIYREQHYYARLLRPNEVLPAKIVVDVSVEADILTPAARQELIDRAKTEAKKLKLSPNDIIGLEDFRFAKP